MHFATLELPAIIRVDDYHEFDYIIDYLKQLGAKRIKYEELGCEGRDYIGIFYSSKDKDYKKLVKEYEHLLED